MKIGFQNEVTVMERRQDSDKWKKYECKNAITTAGIKGIRDQLLGEASSTGLTNATRLLRNGTGVEVLAATQRGVSGAIPAYPRLPDPLFSLNQTESDRRLNLLWDFTKSSESSKVNAPFTLGVYPPNKTAWFTAASTAFNPVIPSLDPGSQYIIIWVINCILTFSLGDSGAQAASKARLLSFFGGSNEIIKAQQAILYRLGDIAPDPKNDTTKVDPDPAPLIAKGSKFGAFSHGSAQLVKIVNDDGTNSTVAIDDLSGADILSIIGDVEIGDADNIIATTDAPAGQNNIINLDSFTVPAITGNSNARVRWYGLYLNYSASSANRRLIDVAPLEAADLPGGVLTPFFFGRTGVTGDRVVPITIA